ncbi:ty3-gypsy retrotransposon protein [Cucumis melo var. makuwa]|uniref:Ty3-gypsy retrotransposon protein n=1 Tax=Cucumis melo var. makuwa TaxID=1194695 RepID=A0A5D3CH03_CUCMM|nr:ty3-gypsy retrotransposon protein [Cucumis melo var. makuwa]
MTVAESKGNTTFPIQTITLRSSNANEVHRETNTRRLPNAEFQARREKGLCFRCNEKYSADHKCKMKELCELRMFVVVNENEEYEIIEEKEGEEKELAMMVVKENNKGYAELSINSVIGLDDPGTMKVRGKLHDEDIIILIDCGATHNFLLKKLVEKFEIPTKETTHYGVILGSGTTIQGKGWLHSLGITVVDWKNLMLTFIAEGKQLNGVMEVTNDQKKEWQCTDALIVETNPSTQPMFIAMVLTKLNSPLRLKLACLLDTLCTNKAIYSFSHPHVNTLSPWMSTFLRIVSSYLGLLQGESVSEESNYVVLLESTYPTLVTLPDQNSHTIDLHTNRVLWKIYYKRNFKKEVGSFAIQPAPVQDSEPLQDQVLPWDVEVAKSRVISMSQRKYNHDLLVETGMMGCRPADTAIEFNAKLGNSDLTSPMHTMSIASQFMQASYKDHVEAVNKIMRQSTSRYCTFVWGNIVTWRSKKQGVVARRSSKVE